MNNTDKKLIAYVLEDYGKRLGRIEEKIFGHRGY